VTYWPGNTEINCNKAHLDSLRADRDQNKAIPFREPSSLNSWCSETWGQMAKYKLCSSFLYNSKQCFLLVPPSPQMDLHDRLEQTAQNAAALLLISTSGKVN
jgi:hypothetical protein